MIIHLVSDLHIDFDRGTKLNLPGGNILLIAGDTVEGRNIDTRPIPNEKLYDESTAIFYEIARQNRIATANRLNEELKKYNRVIKILGNHEFYNTPYDETMEIMAHAFPSIEFLSSSWTNLNENTVLYGGTMWTDFDHNNPLVEMNATRFMNDFAGIIKWKNGEHFSVNDALKEFKFFHDNLRKCIRKNPGKDIIVMSHHCPSFKGTPARFVGNACNGYFSAHCDDVILDNPEIKMWLHGHTHDITDYMIGDCRIACMPRGYYPNDNCIGYKPLEIELL